MKIIDRNIGRELDEFGEQESTLPTTEPAVPYKEERHRVFGQEILVQYFSAISAANIAASDRLVIRTASQNDYVIQRMDGEHARLLTLHRKHPDGFKKGFIIIDDGKELAKIGEPCTFCVYFDKEERGSISSTDAEVIMLQKGAKPLPVMVFAPKRTNRVQDVSKRTSDQLRAVVRE